MAKQAGDGDALTTVTSTMRAAKGKMAETLTKVPVATTRLALESGLYNDEMARQRMIPKVISCRLLENRDCQRRYMRVVAFCPHCDNIFES